MKQTNPNANLKSMINKKPSSNIKTDSPKIDNDLASGSRVNSAVSTKTGTSRATSAYTRPTSAYSLGTQSNAESAVTTAVVQLSMLKETPSALKKKKVQGLSTLPRAIKDETASAGTKSKNSFQARLSSALSQRSRTGQLSSAMERKNVNFAANLSSEQATAKKYAVDSEFIEKKLQEKSNIFNQSIVDIDSQSFQVFNEPLKLGTKVVHDFSRVGEKIRASAVEADGDEPLPSDEPSTNAYLKKAQIAFLQSVGEFATNMEIPLPDNSNLAQLCSYTSTAGRELTDGEYFAKRQAELDDNEQKLINNANGLEKELVKAKFIAELKLQDYKQTLLEKYGDLPVEVCGLPEHSELMVIDKASALQDAALVTIPQNYKADSLTAVPLPVSPTQNSISERASTLGLLKPMEVWVADPKLIRGFSQGSMTEDIFDELKHANTHAKVAEKVGNKTQPTPVPTHSNKIDKRNSAIACNCACVVFDEYSAGKHVKKSFSILNQRDVSVRLRVAPVSASPFFALEVDNRITDIAPGIQVSFNVILKPCTQGVYSWAIHIESTAGDKLVLPVIAKQNVGTLKGTIVKCNDPFHWTKASLNGIRTDGNEEHVLDLGACYMDLNNVEISLHLESTGRGSLDVVVLDNATRALIESASDVETGIPLHKIKSWDLTTGMRSEREAVIWKLVKRIDQQEFKQETRLENFTVFPNRANFSQGKKTLMTFRLNPKECLKNAKLVDQTFILTEQVVLATSTCNLIKLVLFLRLQSPCISIDTGFIFDKEDMTGSLQEGNIAEHCGDKICMLPFTAATEAAYFQLKHVTESAESLASVVCDLKEQNVGSTCAVQFKIKNKTGLRFNYYFATADYPSPFGRTEYDVEDKEFKVVGSSDTIEAEGEFFVNVFYSPKTAKSVDKIIELRVPQSHSENSGFKLLGALRIRAAGVPRYVQVLPHIIDLSATSLQVGQSEQVYFSVSNENKSIIRYDFSLEQTPVVSASFTSEADGVLSKKLSVEIQPKSQQRLCVLVTAIRTGSFCIRAIGGLVGDSSSVQSSIACSISGTVQPNTSNMAHFIQNHIKLERPSGSLCTFDLQISNANASKPVKWAIASYSDLELSSWAVMCVPDAGVLAPSATITLSLAVKSQDPRQVFGGLQLLSASILNAFVPEEPKIAISKHIKFNQAALEKKEQARQKLLLAKWHSQAKDTQLQVSDTIPFYIKFT